MDGATRLGIGDEKCLESPPGIYLENGLVPEKPFKKQLMTRAAWKRILVCEKILFGFGSQVTSGEGFVEKHPACPEYFRSLLNICGIFLKMILP